MAKVLHIFDLMPFVHAGHVNKYSMLEDYVDLGSSCKVLRTPTGGTSLIFNKLYEICGKGDIVFCSDRNPTIKKGILPEYKGNREHKHDIEVEKGAAEYILQKCGFTVLASAGYEADDYIYSVVKKFHDNYDEIIIYTGDSDLYFLVDDKVHIEPSSSRAKRVTRATYEDTKVHGDYYRYNSITMCKITGGDYTDCIPPLSQELIDKLRVMFSDSMLPVLGDKDTVRYFVSIFAPEAVKQVDLVFPLDVDELPDRFTEPCKEYICNWGDVINNKNFRNLADPEFDPSPYIKEMQSQGLYLMEGD